MRRGTRGFSLIELLIVVAILGVITAIAIPNLLNAIDRGKQKRSMVDMRCIGTAVESYSVEFNFYPTASDVQTLADVTTRVVPIYVKVLPQRDGWHHDFYVSSQVSGYTIASGGKDGGGLTGVEWGPFKGFDLPIVLMEGTFVAWPEGVQD